MDSDRELLQAAAKAAGYEFGVVNDKPKIKLDCEIGTCGTWGCAKHNLYDWNPLEDDGDALRLAVKLGICIEFGYCEDDAPVVYAGLAHERRDWPRWPNYPDSRAATRRAIVRAAAELGRRG